MYKLLFVLLLAVAGVPIIAQEPTATPVAIPTQMYSDTWQFMATAAASVNTLPDSATRRGTTSLIPAYNATQLFGYLKWVMSGNSTRAVLGQTLAPLADNMLYLLIMVVSVTGVWFGVRLVTFIFKAAVWLMKLFIQILKLIIAVLQFLRSLIPFI
jgi:hypothetical protein